MCRPVDAFNTTDLVEDQFYMLAVAFFVKNWYEIELIWLITACVVGCSRSTVYKHWKFCSLANKNR